MIAWGQQAGQRSQSTCNLPRFWSSRAFGDGGEAFVLHPTGLSRPMLPPLSTPHWPVSCKLSVALRSVGCHHQVDRRGVGSQVVKLHKLWVWEQSLDTGGPVSTHPGGARFREPTITKS